MSIKPCASFCCRNCLASICSAACGIFRACCARYFDACCAGDFTYSEEDRMHFSGVSAAMLGLYGGATLEAPADL
eukprot:CAMPEP_0171228940 /NCGR_PEP_ID=MMETSP0790-20130122/38624_1 /TAXON_ID=2925 /ORGANISM="Alexandrium catenella, Strain OF101" /LENGTH=74 /DNA_ID=CAMNT_0011695105 /DNA_START=419 /DNA_END=643 /DNA_ORIENTATION=-